MCCCCGGGGDDDGKRIINYPRAMKTFLECGMLIIIDSFWDFLFSDRWNEGCLLRVLEGKLLSNLLAAMYILEKELRIISFETFTFNEDMRQAASVPISEPHLYSVRKTFYFALEIDYFYLITFHTHKHREIFY